MGASSEAVVGLVEPRLVDRLLGEGLRLAHGKRLVACPQLVVDVASAERLVAAGELLARQTREIERELVITGLDHDRAATVGCVATRNVLTRELTVRATIEATPRHAVEQLLPNAPVGHLSTPPAGRPWLFVVVVVDGPRPGLAFRHIVLFVAYGVSCRARAEERRYAFRIPETTRPT